MPDQTEVQTEEDKKENEKKVLAAFSSWQADMQNMATMKQIVGEMKEIAELPSEVPKEIHRMEKVAFPDNGGVLTYMEGYEQPYKGFPFFEFVDKIDMIKKTQRAVLSSLYHSLKGQKWKLLFLPWISGDLVRSFIYTAYRSVERFRLKPLRYSDAIRELYRAFSIEWERENPQARETRLQLRDVACMLLEMDNAYRFRFQDIIVELDKKKLAKNPGREVVRLLELMMSRERTQEVKDTWKLAIYFLPTYLMVNRDLRVALKKVLGELDLEKVAFSVEDRFFSEKRLDYQFGFMPK